MSGDQQGNKKGRPRIGFDDTFSVYRPNAAPANQQPPASDPMTEVDKELQKADAEATKNMVRAMQESKLTRLKTEEDVKTAELELKKAEIDQKKELLKPASASDKKAPELPEPWS